MAISPPAPLAGAPLSRRLADTQSSPVRELLKIAMRPEVISLAGGLPAPDTFDVDGLARGVRRGPGGPGRGPRAAVLLDRGRPRVTRAPGGVHVDARARGRPADDLLITTGSQQALGLVATALLDPGDAILVEDPTYLAALQAFQLADFAPSPIPGDEHGPGPGGADRASRAPTGAKVAYLIPTFQNPTGRTMPAERRAALAEAAADRRACGWSRTTRTARCAWRASRVDLLAAQPAARDRTIVIQTLSKVLSPGLRIGYLRAPAALRGPLAVAKQAADLHTSTVAQLAAERWLATHDLGEHIAGLAAHYRPRRDALLSALRRAPPGGLALTRARGRPVHLGRRCRTATTPRRSSPRAIERGVAFVPGKYFYAGEPPPRDAARLVRHRHAGRAARRRRPSRRRLLGVGDSGMTERPRPDMNRVRDALRERDEDVPEPEPETTEDEDDDVRRRTMETRELGARRPARARRRHGHVADARRAR